MSDVMTAALSISGGFFVAAIVFFAIAYFRTNSMKNWTRTTGLVVNRKTGGVTGIPALYPTFRWYDSEGTVHQHTSSMKQSLAPAPGRPVPVRYNPQNPGQAIMDTFVQSGRAFWFIGAFWLVLGTLIGGFLAYIDSAM